MKTDLVKENAALRRAPMKFVPKWHHQSGYPKQPARVEYWNGDDRFRTSLHLHWNWLGRTHWLCVFLPERPGPNAARSSF